MLTITLPATTYQMNLLIGSFNGRPVYAFCASPARPLWVWRVRIKNHAVSNSFENLVPIIFDSNRKRVASLCDSVRRLCGISGLSRMLRLCFPLLFS